MQESVLNIDDFPNKSTHHHGNESKSHGKSGTYRATISRWVNETSLHGVKEIRDSENFMLRMVWVFVTAGALLYCGYQTYLLIKTYIEDPVSVSVVYDTTPLKVLSDYNFSVVYCPSDWIDVEKVKQFPELKDKLFFAFLLSYLDSAELYVSFDTGQQYYHVDHWVRHLIGIPYEEKVTYKALQSRLEEPPEKVKKWLNFKQDLKPFLQRHNFTNLREFFFYIAGNHGSEGNTEPEWRLFRYGRVCGVYKSDPQVDYLFTADGRADFARYFYHNISNIPPNAENVDVIISLNPSKTYFTNRVKEAGRPSDMLQEPFQFPVNASELKLNASVFTELSVDIRHEFRVDHSGHPCKDTNSAVEKYHPSAFYRECTWECAQETSRVNPNCRMQEICWDVYRLNPDQPDRVCPLWGPAYDRLFNLTGYQANEANQTGTRRKRQLTLETSIFDDLSIDDQLALCWQAIDKCNERCKIGRHCEAWDFTPYEFQTAAYFGYKKKSNKAVDHSQRIYKVPEGVLLHGVRLSFGTYVTVTENREMPTEVFFGQIGGAAGLWLGASMLTIIQLVLICLLPICCISTKKIPKTADVAVHRWKASIGHHMTNPQINNNKRRDISLATTASNAKNVKMPVLLSVVESVRRKEPERHNSPADA